MKKRTYTKSDIFTAFEAAGLTQGSTVFVTTSLGMLGEAENVTTQEELNSLFYECLKIQVGKTGNVIVPTYSYTFGKSKPNDLAIYDPETTPAEIGPFPEFFRKQQGVNRSLDPMMSVSGFGPDIKDLFCNLPPTSYGEDSLYERLTKINAKCCSIGLGPNWMPFIHYADYICKVPFRYDKLFLGKIKDENKLQEFTWLYSVPLLHSASRSTGHLAGNLATEAKIWNYSDLGRARVYIADYKKYFDFTVNLIKNNPWTTAFGPPGDPILLERERVNVKPELQSLDNFELNDMLNKSLLLNRREGSEISNELITIISKKLKLTTFEHITGSRHYDSVIPECYTSQNERFFGTLKGAHSSFPQNGKYDIVLAYVNNDGSDNLAILKTALKYFDELTTNNVKILLVLSSPTLFPAWLNTNQNIVENICNIHEFAVNDTIGNPYSLSYLKNPNVKNSLATIKNKIISHTKEQVS
ncbi:MAG: AAC(3) family N-acetyltransferase [Pusillimonas sp.]